MSRPFVNYTFGGYDPDDGLTEGRWVRDGLTMRWVGVVPPEPDPEPAPGTFKACPTCHARVAQTCRTKSGHTTTPHLSRLAPRLCICGELLARRARYCQPCRDAALRESKLESQRRIRAHAKEAA